MAHQVQRQQMEAWLLANGFKEQAGRRSGARKFTLEGQPGQIYLSVGGSNDISRSTLSGMLRTLAEMGFDLDRVRQELGLAKPARRRKS